MVQVQQQGEDTHPAPPQAGCPISALSVWDSQGLGEEQA